MGWGGWGKEKGGGGIMGQNQFNLKFCWVQTSRLTMTCFLQLQLIALVDPRNFYNSIPSQLVTYEANGEHIDILSSFYFALKLPQIYEYMRKPTFLWVNPSNTCNETDLHTLTLGCIGLSTYVSSTGSHMELKYANDPYKIGSF